MSGSYPDGQGSNPCGPTLKTSTDGLTARLLRRNEVMRVRFRLGALDASASLIFDNLVVMHFCAHDVAVACCLAMAEVWVRLPLGALQNPVWPNGKAAPC